MYFSLGVDIVKSFYMKGENLHELFLMQDISGCKKVEIISVKHSIQIYCRKISNYVESAEFVLSSSDTLANY